MATPIAMRRAGPFSTLVGASFAGAPFAGVLASGQATRIATGAVLPVGADTVAMQEICTVDDDRLTLAELPDATAGVRPSGNDIAAGAQAIPAGRTLQAQDIALLGALGFTEVTVVRRLRVAVVSTGLELAAAGSTLMPGQIIDTNGLMLRHLLADAGTAVTVLPPLPDEYEATRAALTEASARYDVIVSTGGVSVGARDYLRDVLQQNASLLFWKLAIRPGKPVMLARLGPCVAIGLPGNPVSAFVTLLLIVRPVLRALRAGRAALPAAVPIVLGEPLTKPAHLRVFPRVRLQGGCAMPYPDQGSNLITSLTRGDGLLDLPAGPAVFDTGAPVLYRPFDIF